MASEFYMDANGSDGTDPALIDRVYPDGTRVPLTEPEPTNTPAQRAGAIPNWATWDEATVVDYINTNVTDLASARTVLVALARMVVALRDAQWPWLAS
jgi:hypothetical protein